MATTKRDLIHKLERLINETDLIWFRYGSGGFEYYNKTELVKTITLAVEIKSLQAQRNQMIAQRGFTMIDFHAMMIVGPDIDNEMDVSIYNIQQRLIRLAEQFNK